MFYIASLLVFILMILLVLYKRQQQQQIEFDNDSDFESMSIVNEEPSMPEQEFEADMQTSPSVELPSTLADESFTEQIKRLMTQQQTKQAEFLLNQALKKEPNCYEHYCLLLDIYRQQQQDVLQQHVLTYAQQYAPDLYPQLQQYVMHQVKDQSNEPEVNGDTADSTVIVPEQSEYVLPVSYTDQVQFSPDQQDKATVAIDLNLTLATYYLQLGFVTAALVLLQRCEACECNEIQHQRLTALKQAAKNV